MIRFFLVLISFFVFTSSHAHHNPLVFYDPTNTIQLEGEIIEVSWRNPHPVLSVRADNRDGEIWSVDVNSVSILRRTNITADNFNAGDKVRIGGWLSKNGGTDMFITNLLVEGNVDEVILWPGSPSLWSDTIAGDWSNWAAAEADLTETTNNIFTIWSTSLREVEEVLLLWDELGSFTENAINARSKYDIFSNHIFEDDCNLKGMPTIMEQPYPMEFIDEGDIIVMRMEEGDARREIFMSEDNPNPEHSPFGYSTGKWEDNALVVHTSNISWPFISMTGIPLSTESEMVETFKLDDNGKRLDYTLTIDDPENLKEPLTVTKYWLLLPDAEIYKYVDSCNRNT
ncbi:MAG: hypothetical protein CBC38_07915 [Gammaproteobacteria bacterium TMED78]|nr:MAG: hypothetical protein CBC38_07915 [Gammaproteobacteria bacterium TMED78]|tara:strand:- start:4040 stop:5065 length:1026 start_codon:yes stop_codon:yes gene_type:complete